MNSVEAAASFIADVPEIIKSNLQSVTIKQYAKASLTSLIMLKLYMVRYRTSLRYSFFSEPDLVPCDHPPVPVFPIYFQTFP